MKVQVPENIKKKGLFGAENMPGFGCALEYLASPQKSEQMFLMCYSEFRFKMAASKNCHRGAANTEFIT